MKFSYDSANPTKIISLLRVNPYLKRENASLPYNYLNPSFSNKFKGPVLRKDYYTMNLLTTHLGNGKETPTYRPVNAIKYKKFKTNKSSAPKEIIISLNKQYRKRPQNIFDNWLQDQERLTKRTNPFITKYGEYNFRSNYLNTTENIRTKYEDIPSNRRKTSNAITGTWEDLDMMNRQKLFLKRDLDKKEKELLPIIEGSMKREEGSKRSVWNNEFIKALI